jgi:hypothetical protein
MNSIGKTLKGYVWWTYPRGSFHYDVMVTLILLFIFATPLFVNFKDRPVERNLHMGEVIVSPDSAGGYVYHIEAEAIRGNTDQEIRESLMGVIEPIAGEVELERYQAVKNSKGKIIGYDVWVKRSI